MNLKLRLKKTGLLPKIIVAIIFGFLFSYIFPEWLIRIFVTFNDLFGQFLGFAIPLIILGLVAPGIAELGDRAGKLLGLTALIAYGSTVFAGFFAFFTCVWTYPLVLDRSSDNAPMTLSDESVLEPFFSLEIPPLMSVVTALVLAFVLGLGLAAVRGTVFQSALVEFREVVDKVIVMVIIPLLPLYIFGIFLRMSADGQIGAIVSTFVRVIGIIFIIHILLLLLQFTIAGSISKKNPFRLLKNMLPAYVTALGTQSSAATIPVTLDRTIKNGVNPELAGFVIPLCATIHLSGSTLKIVACAMAIMYMHGDPTPVGIFAGFVLLLGITMVAAPGVPGGAIMAALGVLVSVLDFDESSIALMIALYITMDSFGTACNVTGDGAIAVVVEKIFEDETVK